MGTEREQPFKELCLSAMNYVNLKKRAARWDVDGLGERCRDKLWKCRIFCCSTGSTSMSGENGDDDDLIGVFSNWAIQNIQVGYPRKQEFHIRYNKLTTMVENKDHLL